MRTARYIFAQLAEGLTYIHSKGVVHRDLKIENFLFSSEGKSVLLVALCYLSRLGVVKIIDFTVSKKLENVDDDTCFDYEGTPAFTGKI